MHHPFCGAEIADAQHWAEVSPAHDKLPMLEWAGGQPLATFSGILPTPQAVQVQRWTVVTRDVWLD